MAISKRYCAQGQTAVPNRIPISLHKQHNSFSLSPVQSCMSGIIYKPMC
ncbi:Uncharacterised protein [Vibrio cholerae]|nr:Uncharacterised protein [Vibrio cholerae]